MTFSSDCLKDMDIRLSLNYKPALFQYAKFLVIFPLELFFDGINVSLLRYGTAFLAHKATQVMPNVCKNNSSLVLPQTADHDHTPTITDFIEHHAMEISLGAAVFFSVTIPLAFFSSPEVVNSVADTVAAPVTFVSQGAHASINFLFNINLQPQKDFLITAYENGHNTFNLFLAIEPLIHTFYYGYCNHETYNEYMYDGFVKEVSMPYHLLNNIAYLMINTTYEVYDYYDL